MAKWLLKRMGTAVARQHDYMTHGSGLNMPNETHPTLNDYWGPLSVSVCVCGVCGCVRARVVDF